MILHFWLSASHALEWLHRIISYFLHLFPYNSFLTCNNAYFQKLKNPNQQKQKDKKKIPTKTKTTITLPAKRPTPNIKKNPQRKQKTPANQNKVLDKVGLKAYPNIPTCWIHVERLAARLSICLVAKRDTCQFTKQSDNLIKEKIKFSEVIKLINTAYDWEHSWTM